MEIVWTRFKQQIDLPFVDENIGAFNISMKHTLIMQILQTSQHLSDENRCWGFCEGTESFHNVGERAILHKPEDKTRPVKWVKCQAK